MILAVALIAIGCNEEESQISQNIEENKEIVAKIRSCATDEILSQQLIADPSYAQRLQDIEEHTVDFEKLQGKLVNGEIVIPVVVNVLYKTDAENISDEQIQSQIDVLNKDFNAENEDFETVPEIFSGVKANIGIRFVLEAVNRKYVNKSTWGTADAMKKTAGITPTSPTTMLNIWVCTIGKSVFGYAQLPGGKSATDGVVIDSKYFGTLGTATYPFNLGRTTTHEVGHWMNLRHIWGDSECGTDYVSDTPSHNDANRGLPSFPHYSECSGSPIEMTMNFMDYTDDRGLSMFTEGQKNRMLSIFSAGGARSTFIQ